MVNQRKLEKSEKTKDLIESYPVIGIIDMHKMPSKQLQEIRKNLRGVAVIKMTKKSILKYALEKVDDDRVKMIEEHLPKQPAFMLTDMEPFKLYALTKNMKFRTFAKEGDESGEDIWVYAGPTSLMAGPVISEFQQAGVTAGIESGKISIKKDKLIVKQGEAIDSAKANILRKLKIEPIEITLDIVAIYEDGAVYTEDVLSTVLRIPGMLSEAFNSAMNLSVSIAYPTKTNIGYLLSKASMEANAIGNLVDSNKNEGKNMEEKDGTNEVTENEQDNTITEEAPSKEANIEEAENTEV